MTARFLIKRFDTGNINIVSEGVIYLGFHLPSDLLLSRTLRFTRKFEEQENLVPWAYS